MFKSIDTNQNSGFDSITFGNNKKGKVKGLGKLLYQKTRRYQICC